MELIGIILVIFILLLVVAVLKMYNRLTSVEELYQVNQKEVEDKYKVFQETYFSELLQLKQRIQSMGSITGKFKEAIAKLDESAKIYRDKSEDVATSIDNVCEMSSEILEGYIALKDILIDKFDVTEEEIKEKINREMKKNKETWNRLTD